MDRPYKSAGFSAGAGGGPRRLEVSEAREAGGAAEVMLALEEAEERNEEDILLKV